MILNVVATPIGNLCDITKRANDILHRASLIVAEDTRTTGKLLKLLDITEKKEFCSHHARSSAKDTERCIQICERHETIALVTDAGTPAISDPGSNFIHEFRQRYPSAKVLPIPGPSALVSAISVSGFKGSHFEFLGFLPHKKGRQTIIQSLSNKKHIVVFYESPHRILKTLLSLSETLGSRPIMIGREITKQFEEYPIGKAIDLYDFYQKNPSKVKGEFVVVISPVYQISGIKEEENLL